MKTLVQKTDDKYPKADDIEAFLLEARIMRARVLRHGAARFWFMLRRGVTRRAALNTHAEA